MTDETNVPEVKEPEVKQEEFKALSVEEQQALIKEKQELLAAREERDRLLADKAKVLAEKKESDRKAAVAKAEAEGDFKKALELEVKARDEKIKAYEQKEVSRQIDDAARSIASKLSTNPSKQALLMKELKENIVMHEGEIKIRDTKGDIQNFDPDKLTEHAKKNYDFLCDALQSIGGAGIVLAKPTDAGTNESKNINPLHSLIYARDKL